MRIRLSTILFAAGAYLIGSGKAQQLWAEAQRWMEDRQQKAGDRDMAGTSRTSYDAEPLTRSPLESSPA